MAFLKRKSRDPVAEAEAELAALQSRRDALDAKLADAAGALATATDDRRQALLDSDLTDEAAANRRDAAVRAAEDRHASIRDALSAIGAKIADVQTLLIAARDRTERAAVALEARAEADALADVRAAYVEISTRLVGAMQRVVSRVPTAPDFLPRVSAIVVSEIPTAIDELIGQARSFAASAESGSSPVHRPAPPPAEPAPEPAPSIERERVYCLAPVRWRESDQIMCSPRFGFASLPVSLLQRALDANLVDRIDTPRTKKMIEGFGVINGPADPSQCIDLDRIDALPAEGQPRTSFVEKVGQPRQILVDANPVG
jgi:hypothetical protein